MQTGVETNQIKLVVNRAGKMQESQESIESLLNEIIKQVQVQMRISSCFIMNLSTGIGKSTQFIHELFKNFPQHKIICSQVTVINTLDLCKFVASTYPNMQLGRNIGYTTSVARFPPNEFHSIHYQTLKITTLRYLMELQNNRLRSPSNHIIVIDEAHTNDVNAQEQLAIIKQLLLTKPRDQLPFFIIQSASIDVNQFMNYFKLDSYILAEGSRKPVKQLFLDDFKMQKETDVYKASTQIVEMIIEGCLVEKSRRKKNVVSNAISELNVEDPSGILIFIAKQKQATMLERKLNASQIVKQSRIQIISISSKTLERDPLQIKREDTPTPKIFISTNVIETGYTIKNISFVVDLMKQKIVYRNPVSKVNIVRDNPIDKQMQQQRRGRVGRTQPGVYIGICPKKVSEMLLPQKELSIQISNIQQNIIQFEQGLNSFLQLEFMAKIPSEHYMDYLQVVSMLGPENITNNNHNIVQDLLFSNIHFTDFRQVLLFIIAINAGIRPFDIIVILSYILTANRFENNRQLESNEFKVIYSLVTQGKAIDVKLSETIQQMILFLNKHQINIYSGIPIDEKQGQAKFATCMSLIYYFFMFKRTSGNNFKSKQGLKLKIDLPTSVKYFVSMVVQLKETYECKFITPISEKDWDILPCEL